MINIMRQLNWNQHEFIECLGVLPKISEFDNSYCFSIKNKFFSFEINAIDYSSVISIYISSIESKVPIFSLQFIVRDEVSFINEKNVSCLIFKDCIVISNDFYGDQDYEENVFDEDKFPKYLSFELHTFPELLLRFI